MPERITGHRVRGSQAGSRYRALIPDPLPPQPALAFDANLIAASTASLSIDEIDARFTARGPWKKRLPQLLAMRVALGRAELREDGSYGAGR